MKVIHSFPNQVRVLENCWIPLSDGCRLAFRIWLPADAEQHPVPAIVEYIPYRKRDGTRWRDEPMHYYFAGHGYAAIRIDLRGSGDSDGLLQDEYHLQEHEDGLEAIGWIAAQPWCSGRIGLIGKSWGGLNVLQLAARRPAGLKALITVCSTDDRYSDDAHYMGGCLLNENLIWGSVLLSITAQPPDPGLAGEGWRATWLKRLEALPLYTETWLRHPWRDHYWKHGSVREDYARITCPVYAVGGWSDGYTNSVPRLLEGLSVPRKGLIGSWGHLYPHEGQPGIGFLQEALRWWDYWLKDIETGIMQEPVYRVWMEEASDPRERKSRGGWVAEDCWPSGRIECRRYYLRKEGLRGAAGPEEVIEYQPDQTVGRCAGSWSEFGTSGEELPGDQLEDDRRSLCFDSPELGADLPVLGAPVVRLRLAVDRPVACLVVRLNEMAPDGSSSRISYGLLNLTHAQSHASPEPLIPGNRFEVEIQLNDIAHVFQAGNRLRLALSTAYWPMVWPSPEPVTLTMITGSAHLELPYRPTRSEDARLAPFDKPETAPPLEYQDLQEERFERSLERDEATGELVQQARLFVDENGETAQSFIPAIDLRVGHSIREEFRIREDDPLSARAWVAHQLVLNRDDWSIRIESLTRFSSTRECFRLEAEVEAYEGERLVFQKQWDERIPRQLV